MKTAVVFLYFMKIILCTADGDLRTCIDYYLSQTQLILEFRGNLPHLWAIYMEGGKTEHQKDPTRRDHPSAIYMYSVYMQRIFPSARIF